VLIDPTGRQTELYGAYPSTTNNRMEITAAIEALRRIPAGASVKLHSDSQYVIKTMTLGWKRRENTDLWPQLDAEVARRRIAWQWVRGHAGDPLNERADELARSAAEGRSPKSSRPLAFASESRSSDNGRSSVVEQLSTRLRAGETIRPCASCGEDFVAIGGCDYCSLARCQLRSRME
jgi:ribonuclease HI